MPDEILELTAMIVAAHVAANSIQAEAIPALITDVRRALSSLGEEIEAAPVELVPAVPVKRSIFPDYIVCLEDGKKLKMLKRHLSTSFNLTPGEYRLRWGLPSTYPMVAPNYAATRSALAKMAGLGKPSTKKVPPSPPPLSSTAPVVTIGRARRAIGSRG